MRFILGVIVIGLLVWATSVAQQTPVENGRQLFRYRFEPGTQAKYRLNAQMSGTLPLFGGLPVEKILLDMTVVLKVRQVRADGNAELGIDVEAFRAEMDGQALPLPLERLRASVRDLTLVVTPQGEVTERKGGSALPLNIPIPGVEASQLPLLLIQLVFPREPISAEQEWSYSRTMTTAPGDPPAQFTARWLKEEAVHDLPASLFNQKMRWSRSFKADIFDLPTTDENLMVKQIEQTVSGDAQIWFSRADGRLVKSVMNAQYEQRTRLLNSADSASQPAPARLAAKVQITREELLTREQQKAQTER
ncbi:MAG: hypothetical protein RMM08_11600 [Armatimonadota bacterium]|nr:hypothetical protein [bacterium]MDW8321994.1 hypothetical protein [Armatimonadota bacterium]